MILLLDIQIHQLRNNPRLNRLMTQSKTLKSSSPLRRVLIYIFLSSCRCCCFFKRKKKKSPRTKWLEQKSPEREAVTLLRQAASHSNSRDSCLNPSQDFIQASQHTLRYPSASVLTSTPTNTPTLPI